VCIGGTSIDEDIQKLEYGQHVVFGTPEPSVTNEEAVHQRGEASVRNGVPIKDGPGDFGG